MQYEFDIEIPEHLILSPEKRQDSFDSNLLSGLIVVGFIGFAKSGKDFISNNLCEQCGFTRVAFADKIKEEMNLHMREIIFEDLKNRGEDLILGEVDFFSDKIKHILRPYIIYFGEKIRQLSGQYFWINKAIENVNSNKIIISDVRREKELDIFRDSNFHRKKYEKEMEKLGIYNLERREVKNYSSYLFLTNQLNLDDLDELTKKTIDKAQQEWLIDFIFRVDSRLTDEINRNKSMNLQIEKCIEYTGLQSLRIDKKKEPREQISMF